MNSRSAEMLTPREQEVIELLSTGLTNEEIARRLGISLDGVKYHVSGIFRRLRVKNRREAASLHLGTDGGVLTPREREVIELISTGLTNEEIARQLGISLEGVKYHVSGILRRLSVESRREAASLHLRTERNGWLAAWAPVLFLRKLPFAWLPKAAAGAVLTTAAAGIALLAWGVLSTSSVAVTTTGCTSVEQSAGNPPNCAPGVEPAAAGPDAISAVSAGGQHTCAVKDKGVWCWGRNGAGATPDAIVPVAVSGLASGVSAISAGANHACALKDGGAVWCWGLYMSDDLGDPGRVCLDGTDTCIVTAPVAVPGLASGVSAISAGGNDTCAVRHGGAWCWNNGFGCRGGPCDSHVAVAAPGLESGVSAISVGWDLRCALKDGGAWCWGSNWAGQLGNNSTTDSPVPVAVSGLGSGVSAISAGDAHVCALKDGGVWCWGINRDGELGNNSTTDSPVPVTVSGLASGVSAISAGGGHTCALKAGGVWCWGLNSHGQVGDNSTADNLVPVAVPGLTSGVSAISAGASHTCALKDDGIRCWGRNDAGQLGNNRPTHSDVPVAVSGLASGVSAIEGACALKAGGVWCWGRNSNGQLGDNSTTDSNVPVAVSGLASGVSSISGGEDHSCALSAGGAWCWGANWAGQLGNNSTTDSLVPVAVSGFGSSVSAISSGEDHSCALKGDGVLCWGNNSNGQLGNNSMTQSHVPVAVPGLETGVSAISGACALRDGGVWCWGFNEFDRQAAATAAAARGDATDRASALCWDARCSTALVAVAGLTSGVSAISAVDFAQGCAIKSGGAWCWDTDGIGNIGLAPVSGLGSGVSAISAISATPGQGCAVKDGGAWCWQGTTGAAPVPGFGSGVSAISAEPGHSCALKEGGVWCWGDNSYGQLGNDSPSYSPAPVPVLFTPQSAGDIAAAPDAQPLPSQPSADPADHRAAYVLGGTAAAALVIVVAGMWAVRRRRSSKTP
ncbi:MAG: LuxR C-terminal-related transcriptional regulator [Chloroflexota bacterium]|nr:LuxR C-terminal-related transcriptional regulator [Chloroflexota bacterium]